MGQHSAQALGQVSSQGQQHLRPTVSFVFALPAYQFPAHLAQMLLVFRNAEKCRTIGGPELRTSLGTTL